MVLAMKMKSPKSLRRTVLALAVGVLLLAPIPMFSQSCALCYTQAASSGQRVIQALKSGILILIVPPTLMSVGLIFVVRRKNGQVRDTDVKDESEQDW